MHAPPFLKAGDTVLLIATARARSAEQLQPAVDILQGWGLQVEKGQHLFKQHHQFAGTDSERTEDLQWAVDHPRAKAVILSGGGYGTLRIIDQVNFAALKEFPKWFVGYSDATVLHARLLSLGMAAIHGTMGFQFHVDELSTGSLRRALFGEPLAFPIPAHPLNRSGACSGTVVGGNLSLIYALSGSRDEIDTSKKILFIEDLDEQLYHIDRMMLQLRRAGKLENLAGLVVGGLSEMKDNAVPYGQSAEEIVRSAVEGYSYPVCFNFPAGHLRRNLAFYIGREAHLNVADPPQLTYLA